MGKKYPVDGVPDRHRSAAPAQLLALLLVSACSARGSFAGEVTKPDTAPPERGDERGERTAAPAAVPVPAHENVVFTWNADDEDAVKGTIRTTLPDGEAFAGRFHQITRTTTADVVSDVYGAWYGEPWADPTWTWADAWPYYGSAEEFVTFYKDTVVATLTGERGTTMRCTFRLYDPARGMESGGHGECQLSNGQRITTQFAPE